MFTPARALAGTCWLSEREPAAAHGNELSVGLCGDATAVSLRSLPTRRTFEMSSAVIVSEPFGAGVDADALGCPAFAEELNVGGELERASSDELQAATASAKTGTATTVDPIRRIIPVSSTGKR
jgi:hypothetical protein